MSLDDNTSKIAAILAAANALPDRITSANPYVTDLGDVSFTHTQESISVDSIGMTGTYDIYTSAELEAPAELITIIDKANSNNYSETEQYLAQNNIQIIFKDEECGTTGRMDIYAENGWIYGELYVYYSVIPFYYGMLDTVCNSMGELVSSFLINTHNSDSAVAEGKIKIELKLYSQDLVTGYTNDNLFANSHIMLLHADWS